MIKIVMKKKTELNNDKKMHLKTFRETDDNNSRQFVFGSIGTERFTHFLLCTQLFIGRAFRNNKTTEPPCNKLV